MLFEKVLGTKNVLYAFHISTFQNNISKVTIITQCLSLKGHFSETSDIGKKFKKHTNL